MKTHHLNIEMLIINNGYQYPITISLTSSY